MINPPFLSRTQTSSRSELLRSRYSLPLPFGRGPVRSQLNARRWADDGKLVAAPALGQRGLDSAPKLRRAGVVKPLMRVRRVSGRVGTLDAVLAAFVPALGLLTFPHHFVRRDTPLYWLLRMLPPCYVGEASPTDCYGEPYGPFARAELLFDLAGDLFVLSVALSVPCLVVLGVTCHAVAQTRAPPRLTISTLSTTALSIFAWAAFWLKYLTP